MSEGSQNYLGLVEDEENPEDWKLDISMVARKIPSRIRKKEKLFNIFTNAFE